MKSLIALVDKLIGTAPDDRKAELEQLRAQLEAELESLGGKKPESNDVQSAIAELMRVARSLGEENKRLLAELARIKEREENTAKALEERAKQERQKQIDAAVEKLVAEGRLPAQNKELIETWRALFEKDFDAASEASKNLTPLKASSDAPSKPEGDRSQSRKSLRDQVAELFSQQTN